MFFLDDEDYVEPAPDTSAPWWVLTFGLGFALFGLGIVLSLFTTLGANF